MAVSFERVEVGSEIEIVAAYAEAFPENDVEKIVTFISCAECGEGFAPDGHSIVYAIFSAPGAEIYDSGVYHEAHLPPIPAHVIAV